MKAVIMEAGFSGDWESPRPGHGGGGAGVQFIAVKPE